MKTTVVYVYPNHSYRELANWFVHSYNVCTAGREHDTLIVTQGCEPDNTMREMFGSLPGLRFLQHDNSGYDIGAFQKASRESSAEMMVFFGTTGYLKNRGWLTRAHEAVERHGDTLYGTMGHGGAGPGIHPHIRTTGFWISPSLFNQYPSVIREPSQRYGFEHGSESLTTWILGMNLTPWVVTMDGEYEIPQWGQIKNGYQNGDQSNLLAGDRLTKPPYYPTP